MDFFNNGSIRKRLMPVKQLIWQDDAIISFMNILHHGWSRSHAALLRFHGTSMMLAFFPVLIRLMIHTFTELSFIVLNFLPANADSQTSEETAESAKGTRLKKKETTSRKIHFSFPFFLPSSFALVRCLIIGRHKSELISVSPWPEPDFFFQVVQ